MKKSVFIKKGQKSHNLKTSLFIKTNDDYQLYSLSKLSQEGLSIL